MYTGFPGLALSLALVLVAPAVRAQSTDEDALKAANQRFYAALNARDLETMGAVWANKPDDVNIGPASKAIDVGYDAIVAYWTRVFSAFSRITVEPSDTLVHVAGGSAWLTGKESAALQLNAGGEPLRFEAFVTQIFEKEGGRWLLVSHQAQIVPK